MKKISVDVAVAIIEWSGEHGKDTPCWISGFCTSYFPGLKVTFDARPTQYFYCGENCWSMCYFKDADGNEFEIKKPTYINPHYARAFATKEEAVAWYNDRISEAQNKMKDDKDFYDMAVTNFINEIGDRRIKE